MPVSIHQLEYKDAPPIERDPSTPWPMWPVQLRVESSHEEGGYREWAAMTLGFSGDEQGDVKRLHGIRVGPKPEQMHIRGTEFTLEVELVLMAAGFSGPALSGIVSDLGVALDSRGNIAVDQNFMSTERGVFCAGDARRGQSLVVWAIAEGRLAAGGVNRFLATA